MQIRFSTFVAIACLMADPRISIAAAHYPPGPGGTCTDSVSILAVQNPAAPCHPAALDTVLGVRGIIIGFDAKASAYGFWIQNRGSGGWNGVQIFTGATNYNSSVPGTPTGGNLALGDSVVVYGSTQEFPAINGGTEIEGPDAVQGTNDIIIRKIASGVPLPAFKVGTTSDFNWVPGLSVLGEQYEGTLVKIRGPLHVARTQQGAGVSAGTFLVVANATPSDTVMIDGATLTTYTAPAVNTVLDSLQGILQQSTSSAGTGAINSYRVQIRDANDVFSATPPNVLNAFFTADNKVRVVFDRSVTAASVGNLANYSLTSFGSVNSATVLTPSTVELDVTSGFSECTPDEGVTVNGVVSSSSGLAMTTAQTRNFVTGVVTLNCIQRPSATALAGSPCDDRSVFAGTGSLLGTNEVTTRGICVAQFGSVYYIEDGTTRGGIGVFGPTTTLVVGHRYLIAGQIQEFGEESELASTLYIADEGVFAAPAATLKTPGILRDLSCDSEQSLDTGEDYEATLVMISHGRVLASGVAGQDFAVVSQAPLSTDTLLVANSHTTYAPDAADIVDVTGILQYSGGRFRIAPRSNADIVNYGPTASVPLNRRLQSISFAKMGDGRTSIGVGWDIQADSSIAETNLSTRVVISAGGTPIDTIAQYVLINIRTGDGPCETIPCDGTCGWLRTGDPSEPPIGGCGISANVGNGCACGTGFFCSTAAPLIAGQVVSARLLPDVAAANDAYSVDDTLSVVFTPSSAPATRSLDLLAARCDPSHIRFVGIDPAQPGNPYAAPTALAEFRDSSAALCHISLVPTAFVRPDGTTSFSSGFLRGIGKGLVAVGLSVGGAVAGAGVGTVVLPIVGTVTGAVAGAIGGGLVGLGGAILDNVTAISTNQPQDIQFHATMAAVAPGDTVDLKAALESAVFGDPGHTVTSLCGGGVLVKPSLTLFGGSYLADSTGATLAHSELDAGILDVDGDLGTFSDRLVVIAFRDTVAGVHLKDTFNLNISNLPILGSLVDGEPVRGSSAFAVTTAGAVSLDAPHSPNATTGLQLEQNTPNPARGLTRIRFSLSEAGVVTLRVFDVAGREVSVVMRDERLEAGAHEVVVRMPSVPSGIYMYDIQVGGKRLSRKMLFVR